MMAGSRSLPDFDRSYFERQYRDYRRQNPPRKLRFYRRLAEGAAGLKERPRILDVGCAFGLFLSQLNGPWDRFGIDASDYALDQARRHVLGATFAVSVPGEIPFEGPFDVITAFDVLEHIPDLKETLRLFARSLARGGALIFVVPVYDGPTGPIIRALDKDPTHVHKESRQFWLGWAAADFRLIDWWGICRYLLPGGYYLHWVTRRLRMYTPAIACVLKRP